MMEMTLVAVTLLAAWLLFRWWQRRPAAEDDPAMAQIRAILRAGATPQLPDGLKCWRHGVAGESFKNKDGSDRQKIIARLMVGDSVRLEADPGNRHDRHAVKVMAAGGQIGFLPKGHHLDAEVAEGRLFGFIAAINEGDSGMRGVTLLLVQQQKT